jgi:hypothetical protein
MNEIASQQPLSSLAHSERVDDAEKTRTSKSDWRKRRQWRQINFNVLHFFCVVRICNLLFKKIMIKKYTPQTHQAGLVYHNTARIQYEKWRTSHQSNASLERPRSWYNTGHLDDASSKIA